ncbi:MAG: pyridoxal phosphate-dependent aminotransferase [Candidatus Zixiibacteriota bacterium]|nr:MAG: pyridoxal phosphate-dependent aminotransferase [candidate division Zixibacteria bacterium]
MKLAERMSRLGTETAFVVLAKAKQLEAQGRDIVHLEIGEPDFDTPRNIIDSAIKALNDGWTHYGPSAGLPGLREVIAEEVSKTRGVKIDPSQVVVTPGGKPIMFFAMLALLNEGDEVIYPNPGFPIYESVIDFLGAKPVPIKLWEKNQFRLDVNELARLVTPKTRMMVINSPQNPTGSVLTEDDLKAISEIAMENDIIVLSDEIYSRIPYSGKHYSIYSLKGMPERTIILDGYSKTYAMTGWRLGYGVMPADLAEQVAKLQTNCNSCTASFTQVAGIEGIKGPQDEVDKMVAEFRKRRDAVVAGLNKIKNVSCLVPDGAFYVFPNVSGFGLKSAELADRILDEAGVAVLSGTSFGAYGEGYIRISYANSIANISKALERLDDFFGKL